MSRPSRLKGPRMKIPKISVIMPVYNAPEPYLREAMDSILDQTFRDFEFIIVNDGSTDKNVEKTIKSYKDKRIKYFKKPNSGIIDALNLGLSKARGEFIARMDSDDISHPERFARQLVFFKENSGFSLVGTAIETFGAGRAPKTVVRPAIVDYMTLMHGCHISHPTVMWRRADFEKYGLAYKTGFGAAEDYELWSRAVRFVKIGNIPDVMLRYRLHDGQLTRIKAKKQKEAVATVVRRMVDFLTGEPAQQKTIRRMTAKKYWLILPLARVRYGRLYLFGLIPLWKI